MRKQRPLFFFFPRQRLLVKALAAACYSLCHWKCCQTFKRDKQRSEWSAENKANHRGWDFLREIKWDNLTEQEEWDIQYCEYCCLAVTKLTFVWVRIDLTTPYVIQNSFIQCKTLSFTSIKKVFCLTQSNCRPGTMLMRDGISEGLRLPSTDIRREKTKLGVMGAVHRRRVY